MPDAPMPDAPMPEAPTPPISVTVERLFLLPWPCSPRPYSLCQAGNAAEAKRLEKEAAALQEARGGPSKYAARKAKRVQEEARAIAAEKAQVEEKKEAPAKEEEPPPRKKRRRRRRRRGPRTE